MPERLAGAERAAELVRETWRAMEEFNVNPSLTLEALFIRLRRELGGVSALALLVPFGPPDRARGPVPGTVPGTRPFQDRSRGLSPVRVRPAAAPPAYASRMRGSTQA